MGLSRLLGCHGFVFVLRLTLAALIGLSGIAAGPAAAQGPIVTVPFQGASIAVATNFTMTPEEIFLTGMGNGHATQLGAFTLIGTKHINLVTRTFTAEITATAANGDQLLSDPKGCSTFPISRTRQGCSPSRGGRAGLPTPLGAVPWRSSSLLTSQ
jgi:hypothetical protein